MIKANYRNFSLSLGKPPSFRSKPENSLRLVLSPKWTGFCVLCIIIHKGFQTQWDSSTQMALDKKNLRTKQALSCSEQLGTALTEMVLCLIHMHNSS